MNNSSEFKKISLDEILVDKYNVRKKDIDKGLDDIAASIKAVGLLQPITVYKDDEKGKYVILAGQRRLNAFHYLNDNFPQNGYDQIDCKLIDEPPNDIEKMSISLAENITQATMATADIVEAVTKLFDYKRDYDYVRDKLGLTEYMVKKYVKLSRLPEKVVQAIKEGVIHPKSNNAENAALRAVDALQWIPNSGISEDDVIELAVEYAKDEIDNEALDAEARKGGTVEQIKEGAKKRGKTKLLLNLDVDLANKLKRVSEESGENESSKAIRYIASGVQKDLDDHE